MIPNIWELLKIVMSIILCYQMSDIHVVNLLMVTLIKNRFTATYASSISAQLKRYLRWWREVVELPEAAHTGSDVTGSHVTGRDPDRNRKYVLRMRNRYILYYYYSSSTKCSTVVQVPWLPEVTEGHVTPKGVPLGVRMRNRKLHNIRPGGPFHRKWRHHP